MLHTTAQRTESAPSDGNDGQMSAQSPEDGVESNSRRERAAIAAQACQTCRSRKSKCDEKRPKCGLCTRLNVECVYREPLPTKKDKTLVHILQVLERMESKVDRLGTSLGTSNSDDTTKRHTSEDVFGKGPSLSWDHTESDGEKEDGGGPLDTYLPPDLLNPTSHVTASHRVFIWPAIFLFLSNMPGQVTNDLTRVLQEGSPWLTHNELLKHPDSLPGPTALDPSLLANKKIGPSGVAGLTLDNVSSLVDTYFNSYNIIHPILDRDIFYTTVVDPLSRGIVDDININSCLAMAVLALGQMATAGINGPPTDPSASTNTGFRGGTVTEPPGIELFNEARRRFGFVMNSCSIENVQTYLLFAIYYEACGRHMDFWRCCAGASMAFQVYVRSERIDWSETKSDIVRRVYWNCIINEDLYHLELDLPRTGIYTLEDKIPLPSFHQLRYISATQSDTTSQFHYHFLAMIALRRLIARIHAALHSDGDDEGNMSEDATGPPIHLINELGRQLESWRTYLPQALQWSDRAPLAFPDISPLNRRRSDNLFNDDDFGGHGFGFNFDVVTAQLRTRFYYARFLIYRPFIYKALHFGESMTEEDASLCAFALQSACNWPVAMYPCRNKKRLIPHLFTWTQNFIGILLIFRMASENPYLGRICEERVNKRDIQMTVRALLDWISDIKAVDGMAEWSWRFLEPLYANMT